MRDSPLLSCVMGLLHAQLSVSFSMIAKQIALEVLRSWGRGCAVMDRPAFIPVSAVEAFVTAYSVVFEVKNGSVSLKR